MLLAARLSAVLKKPSCASRCGRRLRSGVRVLPQSDVGRHIDLLRHPVVGVAARYFSHAHLYLNGTSWFTSQLLLMMRLSSTRMRLKDFEGVVNPFQPFCLPLQHHIHRCHAQPRLGGRCQFFVKFSIFPLLLYIRRTTQRTYVLDGGFVTRTRGRHMRFAHTPHRPRCWVAYWPASHSGFNRAELRLFAERQTYPSPHRWRPHSKSRARGWTSREVAPIERR